VFDFSFCLVLILLLLKIPNLTCLELLTLRRSL
jgi:hypothetical protein